MRVFVVKVLGALEKEQLLFPCKHVFTLYGKREFADMSKDFEWGEDLGGP